MLRLHESPDEFTGIDARPIPAELPRVKVLRPSGRREVLKPIAHTHDFAKRSRYVRLAPVPGPPRFSWYHRSLAFSGALAAAALILGIFAGFYSQLEPTGGRSDVVLDRPPEGILAPYEPNESDLLPAATGSSGPKRPYSVRSVVKRNPAKSRVVRTAYRRTPYSRPSHLVMSEFVPTTLVIYIENGEVKTRIEQQFSAAHKKKI
jgi:hypothetical protein